MTPPLDAIDVNEAARQLGVARQRVYQLVALGLLPATKHHGRVWIPQAAVEARLAGEFRLNSNQCLSPEEVAEFFGVNERTVREWNRTGLLKAQRINNRLCFSPTEVIDFTPPATGGKGRPPKRRGTRTIRGRYYPVPRSLKGNHAEPTGDPGSRD